MHSFCGSSEIPVFDTNVVSRCSFISLHLFILCQKVYDGFLMYRDETHHQPFPALFHQYQIC